MDNLPRRAGAARPGVRTSLALCLGLILIPAGAALAGAGLPDVDPVGVYPTGDAAVADALNADSAVPDILPARDLRREFALLGGSTASTWRWHAGDGGGALFGTQEIGGHDDEFGVVAEPEQEDEGGSSNFGRKVAAGALSAVLPGAGQFYNDQHKKAYIMFGVEVVIWGAYFVFDDQGDNRMAAARDYAGAYAATSGDHDDDYWQAVGGYMDSDAYNEDLLREARALQEEPSGLVGAADAWQWVNEDRFHAYQKIRADGNNAYDRRDFMILFAVINRAVSVVDAVIGAGAHDGKLETEVMGLNLELEPLPSWRDPGAQCVISRRF